MADIQIRDSLNPISEADIAQLEARLGILLPSDYKNFLLAHNGGKTEPWMMYEIHECDADDHAIVGFFFGIGGHSNVDLEANMRTYEERVPSNILPIASDPGSNLLCISVAGKDKGRLYFWTHEEECDEGEIPTYDNLYPVADNFDVFWASLVPFESPL